MHSIAALHMPPRIVAIQTYLLLLTFHKKMSATLLTCSTMTTPITLRIIFIVLVVQVVLVPWVPPLLYSQLTVCIPTPYILFIYLHSLDQKQARDLVAVLTEAKQQIDPRLVEMTRYGGGGGGGRYGGGGGYRGGRGGGRGKSL